MLDLDGNERASIGLRSNTFNTLHIFLDQLTRRTLPPATRAVAIDAFMEVLESGGLVTQDMADLSQRDGGTGAGNRRARKTVAAQPKKWTKEQIAQELHRAATRQSRKLAILEEDKRDYPAHTATIGRLLKLTPADFDPGKFKLTEVIPARSGAFEHRVGPPELRHGSGPAGTRTGEDGKFDWERSFARVDYLKALHAISVRNNVQEAVAAQPIDFTAVETPQGIWLYRDEEHQALIQDGRLVPVARFEGRP